MANIKGFKWSAIPFTLFVNSSASQYICVSCRKIPFKMGACDEGHYFCVECLNKCVNQGISCPVDNKAIKNALFSFEMLDDEIHDLKVFCPFSRKDTLNISINSIETKVDYSTVTPGGPGFDVKDNNLDDNKGEGSNDICNWQGKMSELMDHVGQCPYSTTIHNAMNKNRCLFGKIGCKSSDCNNTKHTLLLLNQVTDIRDDMNDIKKQMNSLQTMFRSFGKVLDNIAKNGFNGNSNNNNNIDNKNDDLEPDVQPGQTIEHKKVDISDNYVIGCGCNEKGEFGLDNTDNLYEIETINWTINKNIVEIKSCLYKGFVFYTNENKIFISGQNDFGGFGIGNEESQTKAMIHPFYSNKINAKHISQSNISFHMFIIDDQNNIYCQGANEHGQLGLNNDNKVLHPKLNKYFNSDINISQISCGEYHSLFLQENGELYGCGSNSSGQLGSNNSNDIRIPSKIALKSLIKSVICGRDHSYCLDINGKIYAFGSNKHGQLGINNPDIFKSDKPIKIEYFQDNNITIRKVVSGNNHGSCLDDIGQVYCWGLGTEGAMGNSSKKNSYTPIMVEKLKSKRIIDLHSGCHHIVTLTDDKIVYSWGNNRFGQSSKNLKKKIIKKPHELYKSNDIINIYAGSYSTLIMVNQPL